MLAARFFWHSTFSSYIVYRCFTGQGDQRRLVRSAQEWRPSAWMTVSMDKPAVLRHGPAAVAPRNREVIELALCFGNDITANVAHPFVLLPNLTTLLRI